MTLHRSRTLAIFVFALAMSASRADAQSDTEIEDDLGVEDLAAMDLEDLLGVVVVASGEGESLFQAPAAVTVLDREDIRARAATTVPDLLRTVPGVQVVRVAPGNYVVSLRGTGGLQGNNVIVLLDGMPLNSPIDANIDWANLPIDVSSIDRIEVARGPVSPIFGANAYTGVIRIDTVAGEADGAARFQVGVRGAIDHAANLGGTVHGDVRGHAGALRYSLRVHGTEDRTWTESGNRDQSGMSAGALSGRFALDLGEHAALELDVGTSVARASAADALVLEPGPHRTHLTYGRAALSLTELAPAVESVELWSHARSVQRFSDDDDFIGFHYDDTRSLQSTTGLDVDFALPGGFELSLGSEINLVQADAPFIHPAENDQLRLGYGFRINGRIDIAEQLVLSAAARLDVTAFADELPVSFRASATYYKPRFSVRLTAGSAYRNPTYVEVGGRFTDQTSGVILLEGNPGLDVPRFESIELAVTAGLLDTMTLQLTSYVARARSLIEGDFEPLVRKTFRNSEDDTALLGFEAELGYGIADDLRLDVTGSAIVYLDDNDDPSVTVGTQDHNSVFIGSAAMRWTPMDGRGLLAGTLVVTTGRDYVIRAGIPPQLAPPILAETNARIELVGGYEPIRDVPLGLRLAVTTYFPHGMLESPIPDAAELGTLVMASVVYESR
jgi:outer membrane cobalamin receptor